MPSQLTKSKAWRNARQKAYRQHLLRERLRAGERIERCQICDHLVTPAGMLQHERTEHPRAPLVWFTLEQDGYLFEVNQHNHMVVSRDGELVERIVTRARTSKGAIKAIHRWLAIQAAVQLRLELST